MNIFIKFPCLVLAVLLGAVNCVSTKEDPILVIDPLGHSSMITNVMFTPDGRILASASNDQTIKLWNIATGELLASLFVTVDNEWICWTPKGYYAASAGGEKYMGWHVNQGMDKEAKYYPVYSFNRRYKKPDLVTRTIELFSFKEALAEYNETSRDKIDATAAPMIFPPKVQWLSPVTYSQKTTARTLLIRAQIVSGKKITDFKILVNGRTAAIKSDIKVPDGAAPTRKTIEYPVPLKAGENRIAIFAAHRDASAFSSERLVEYEDIDYLKPNLYVVSIGISEYEKKEIRLNFADDDARAISRLFASQKGRLFKNVYIKPLYDAEATRENIINALEWLEKTSRKKTRPWFLLRPMVIMTGAAIMCCPVRAIRATCALRQWAGMILRISWATCQRESYYSWTPAKAVELTRSGWNSFAA